MPVDTSTMCCVETEIDHMDGSSNGDNIGGKLGLGDDGKGEGGPIFDLVAQQAQPRPKEGPRAADV